MKNVDKPLLEVQNINTFYGLSQSLFDVSFQINKSEIICLLGRNGAGKTTTMRSLVGLTPPKNWEIFFSGEDISKKPTHYICRKGLICSFSDKRVFGKLSVKENLEIAKQEPRYRDSENLTIWDCDSIYELFPKLKYLSNRWAGTLSGGEQQMLGIAKALMGNPRLLLLDEPTIGLAPVIVNIIGELIKKIKQEGISLLISEQNIKFALDLGERFYILDVGEIKYQGTREELLKRDDLVTKYLTV
jgi:branched-chain amino acid transport system ATP-binding protein